MAKKTDSSFSLAEKEIEQFQKNHEAFENQIKELTFDQMNKAPKLEEEPQTKIAQRDLDKCKRIYLKPRNIVMSRDKFNERFRSDWEYAKEYVQFIAEHKENPGEKIEMWTRPFGGVPAEFWEVPVNMPVWGPRYLAEQIKKASYHVLSMEEKVTGSNQIGYDYGRMIASHTKQRLDAQPVSQRKSIFMGEAANF